MSDQVHLNSAESGRSQIEIERLCRAWERVQAQLIIDCSEFEIERSLREGRLHVDSRDYLGRTPLMLAVERGLIARVAFLFQFNPDIHLKGPSGQTAVSLAFAPDQHAQIVQLFLDALKAEYSWDYEGLALKLLSVRCPLYFAVLLKDSRIMSIMLEKRCAVNEAHACTFKTALHEAMALRDFRSVKVLIDHGADVNAEDSNGSVPFACCESFDDSEREVATLKTFVERGASLTTGHDEIPIHWALRRGKREVLRVLLGLDVDWCATNGHGVCPLYYLASNETLYTCQEIVDELRGKKLDVQDRDSVQWVLSYALKNFVTKLVELLLDIGVNPDDGHSTGRSSLLAAAGHRGTPEQNEENRKIFTLLLERGADPQFRDDFGFDTVFQTIVKFKNWHLAESALGQLAINESLGIAVTDSVLDTINSRESLRDQFWLCKTQLEVFRRITFCDSVTLYELLIASQKALVVYARKVDFLGEWESFIDSCTNSYYKHILKTIFKEIMKIVRLRKGLCQIMKIHYHSYPAIVDNIIDYVIF